MLRLRATALRLARVAGRLLPLLLAWAALAQPAAAATAYSFPGRLPAGCSGANGSYTCPALSLSWNDSISVSAAVSTTTITVNGNFYTNNADINGGGPASRLKLVVTGTLTTAYQAVINGDVTAAAVNDSGGAVAFGGSVTATGGGVSLSWGTNVAGSIRSGAGDITLDGFNTVDGSITSATGDITLGFICTVGGNIGSAGAIDVGQAITVGGTVTGAQQAVSIGFATQVTGDTTAHASTLTVGGIASVAACARSVASKTLRLQWGASAGGVCCGGTCGTACVSNASGSSMPPACAGPPFVAGERYSLESWDLPGDYVRHSNYLGYVDPVDAGSGASDATFIARPGRADASCWSFESVNQPGYYLRHQNFVLKLHASDGSALYDKDTTFCVRTGLAGAAGISLESINYPGYYIRHDSARALGIAYADGSAGYKPGATFRVAAGMAGASSLHHVEIRHASGAGVTCAPATLTVAACQDSACTTPYTGGLSGTVTAAGSSAASFSIASGSSTASVSLQRTAAGAYLLGTTGLSTAAAGATACNFGSPACTFTFADSGLLFDVPDHVAESAQAFTVSAVKKADGSLACVPAFAGVSRSVTFRCSYANPGSGSLPVRIGGRALNAANQAAAACDASGQAVSLSFDAAGVAATTAQYADAGQLNLTAVYTGSGADAGLVMSGSDSFVAAPASFAITGLPALGRAGVAFSGTVTARNSAGSATPNYGRETPAQRPVMSASSLWPGPGTAGAFTAGSLGSFSGGAAGWSGASWAEAGTLGLAATDASYLSSGLGAGGSASLRVVPHHFDVTLARTAPCSGSVFSYAGQPFTATVTARNAAGAVTTNYAAGGAAQAGTLAAASTPAGTSFSGAPLAAGAFALGVGSGNVALAFADKLTAPQTIAVRATDADGVSSAAGSEASIAVRSGRLRVANGFGGEKAALGLAVLAEYWTGSTWLKNADDTGCPSVPAAAVALSNRRDGKGAAGTWSTSASPVTITQGLGTLTLAAPTPAGSTGTVDIAINLGSGSADQSCLTVHPGSTGAAMPWLRSMNGAGPAAACAGVPSDRDPAARASFGIYSPESKRTVHVRDLF